MQLLLIVCRGHVGYLQGTISVRHIGTYHTLMYTVKPLYSGHLWDVANWLLYKGGLIIQCTNLPFTRLQLDNII